MKTGTLFVVGTPIGNLEDITYRAIKTLAEVDLILCEDTRTTQKLLSRFNIKTKTISYNAHASSKKHDDIVSLLKEGKNIALVSDAGTPGISDPGSLLVSKVREEGIDSIVAVPGPTAITALFSIAGIFGNEFAFLGFAPHKKGRKTFFESLPKYSFPVIFYESNHRILKALESLKENNVKKVVIGRELTKMYEEVLIGTPEELIFTLSKNPNKQKGEFTVLIDNK